MEYILGINAYHGDSSACLFRNEKLVAAVEEERFRRIKHWAGFPSEAIRYCLQEAGIGIEDIEHVAINSDSKASLWPKIRYLLSGRPGLSLVREKLNVRKRRNSIRDGLDELGHGTGSFQGTVHRVEHHLAHLASCYLVSPFDNSTVVSVDGFGDFCSAAWGTGSGERIEIAGRAYFPHSLGIFYQALTQYLGFPHYGDEYKIMGLAPYGKPAYLDRMREIVKVQQDGGFRLNLAYFRHHVEKIGYEWDDGLPLVGKLYTQELESLLGPERHRNEPLAARHRDIARSVQAMYEEAFFNLLNSLHNNHQSENLCLAGGCAMNSVANGLVRERTPYRNVYVQAAAGDAGGAIGAALVAMQRTGKSARQFVMDHAYWGPRYQDDQVGQLLEDSLDRLTGQACTVRLEGNDEALCGRVARAIVDGKVVGWFQGRMEWGPRALGNRSILGDPRRPDMKDLLNEKIKRRESFRPFAPSILRERVADWFEIDDDVPFMMKVYRVREAKRNVIPAVTHVDGSGRLQTVRRETNPLYYLLIEEIEKLTGVPIVLNTSFNENEPVVCRPEEALECFLRTSMDVLVLGHYIVSRNSTDIGV